MTLTHAGPKRVVVFAHNGPLYRGKEGGLYGTHITDELRQRYLQLGGHVHFLMRERRLPQAANGYSKLLDESMSFTPVPEVLTPRALLANKTQAKRQIDDVVRSSDIVVARIPSLIGRWAVTAAKRHQKPYLIECVACNWDALSNHKLLARIAAPWYWLMQRRVVAQAPFVIYVTSEFLQKRYPTRARSFAISNVELPDTGLYGEAYAAEAADHTTKDGQQVLRLVTVASVSTPYKGQQDVIKAVSALREVGIACEYHLIGGGSTDRLKAVADRADVLDRVHFHGAVRHADVFPLLQTMDIYIQPSRQEGLPRALIEAMSCGLPGIGATTGGIPELLPNELLYRPGDIPRLVQLIKQLGDKTARQTEGLRNTRHAAQFSAASLEAKRKTVYAEFLSMHGLA